MSTDSRDIIYTSVAEDLQLNVHSDGKRMKIKSIMEPYLLTDEAIYKIDSIFESEMELGLLKTPSRQSSLQMANTFIPKHLTGEEQGEFMALDLGGTNFRVIWLKLDPDKNDSELDCTVKYYHVPQDVRHGEGRLLFEFLADCIHHFQQDHGLSEKKLPLGFCFSFPMIQTGIDEGILITWTKSFDCKNVVGKEVGKMLKEALSSRKVEYVEVVAVVNDTTGTMMMGSYLDKRSAIGLILGTGCNAAYFEKVERIQKWDGKHKGINEVIIDIEWGAFGDNGVLNFMKTDIDFQIDEESLIKHSFTFEKLFAGRYVGSIVKKLLCHLIKENIIFTSAENIPKEWTFTAADISNALETCSLNNIIAALERERFKEVSLEYAEIIRYICAVISVRGALMVSICLANLLRRMDRECVTIAVDGSLYKNHPKYKIYMEQFIRKLAPGKKFQFILAEDGSGKGAGLVAAVVTTIADKSGLHA